MAKTSVVERERRRGKLQAKYASKRILQAKEMAELITKALPDLRSGGSVEVVVDERQKTITVTGDDASQENLLKHLNWIDPEVKELPQSGPARDPYLNR